jgi:hypothetical protein
MGYARTINYPTSRKGRTVARRIRDLLALRRGLNPTRLDYGLRGRNPARSAGASVNALWFRGRRSVKRHTFRISGPAAVKRQASRGRFVGDTLAALRAQTVMALRSRRALQSARGIALASNGPGRLAPSLLLAHLIDIHHHIAGLYLAARENSRRIGERPPTFVSLGLCNAIFLAPVPTSPRLSTPRALGGLTRSTAE